jgi:hypothetical protein
MLSCTLTRLAPGDCVAGAGEVQKSAISRASIYRPDRNGGERVAEFIDGLGLTPAEREMVYEKNAARILKL